MYTLKGFQDDWSQVNNMQTFTDRHLLIPTGPILDIYLVQLSIAPNLVPWFLKKIFLLEMVKNDICLVGASKQNALFSKKCAPKMQPCPHYLE